MSFSHLVLARLVNIYLILSYFLWSCTKICVWICSDVFFITGSQWKLVWISSEIFFYYRTTMHYHQFLRCKDKCVIGSHDHNLRERHSCGGYYCSRRQMKHFGECCVVWKLKHEQKYKHMIISDAITILCLPFAFMRILSILFNLYTPSIHTK